MSILLPLVLRNVGLTAVAPSYPSFEPLDDDTFQTLQQSLLNYIQSEYLFGSAEADASCESHYDSYAISS